MKNYLAKSLAALLLLVVATALFSAWADPYNIYRFASADTQRLSRTNQTFSMRLSKPWQLRQLQPQAAIIGSSRSGSIRPRHPAWRGLHTFNMSMAGLTLYEMKSFIQLAHESGRMDTLVIGLDYETFIADDYLSGIGYAQDRMSSTTTAEFLLQGARDLRDTLLSTSALTQSLIAIRGQAQIGTEFYPDGSWKNNATRWQGKSGYISAGNNLVRLVASPPAAYEKNLQRFAGILQYCHQQAIDVRLFVSPEHLFLTNLRDSLGKGAGWQDFHRHIATLNENSARDAGARPFPLWGFNQLDGAVNEQLPGATKRGKRVFRDGIHFAPRLGRKIMAQILEDTNGPGMKLGTENIDAYLQSVQTLLSSFEQNQREMISSYHLRLSGLPETRG